jgi:hypothetical protein
MTKQEDRSELGRKLVALRRSHRGGFNDPEVVKRAVARRIEANRARKAKEAADAAADAQA